MGILIYTNKSLTNCACSVMNLNRNSGFLPISSDTMVRVFSVSSAPSSVRGGNSTRIKRLVFGDIVVSFNWFGIISPRPLNREISIFLFLYLVFFKFSNSSSVSTYIDSVPQVNFYTVGGTIDTGGRHKSVVASSDKKMP